MEFCISGCPSLIPRPFYQQKKSKPTKLERKKRGTTSHFLKVIKMAPVSFSRERLTWGRGACVLNGNVPVGLGDPVHLIL